MTTTRALSLAAALAVVILTVPGGSAEFAANLEEIPRRTQPGADPLDRDGDGVVGEESAIGGRVDAYLRRHSLQGRLTSADMLARSQWSHQVWQEEQQRRRAKGVEGDGWVTLGPVNGAGRVARIAVHPTREGTLLAGSASGGVWKTVDGGLSWYPTTDGLSDLAVGSVAYAPSNPEIAYLGTGEGDLLIAGGTGYIPGIGLLRSEDGGESWILPAGPEDVVAELFFDLDVDPSDPDVVLAATNRGLVRTADGGATWEMLVSTIGGLRAVTDLERSPSNPDLLYAGMWCEGGCGAGISRVMRSTDRGLTWLPTASIGLPGLEGYVNRLALAMAPSDDQRLYAGLNVVGETQGTPNSAIYRSDDGGETWTNTAATDTYLGAQAWYDNTLVVSPDNSDVVVAGGVWYVVSDDGGETWTRRNPYAAGSGSGTATLPHVDAHHLVYQGDRLWLGCDGGVWFSDDDGMNWTGRNDGMVTRQYYGMAIDPVNRERVLGGTQDNATNLRRDAGDDTWDEVIGGDGFECAINPIVPDIMYGSVYNTYVVRNTRGGSGGWSDISPPFGTDDTPFITPLTMRGDAPWVLYTGSTRVWETNDGGDTWIDLPTEVTNGAWTQGTIWAIAVTPADPEVLLVSKGQVVYRSADRGETWQWSIFSGRTAVNVELSPFDPDIALAAMDGPIRGDDAVLRTTDGGASWHAAGTGLPPFTVQVVRFDPTDPEVAYAGTDVGLYRSLDGGLTWSRYGDGLPAASIHDLRILPDGSMLRVATYGRGMWELVIDELENERPTVDLDAAATVRGNVGDSLPLTAEVSEPEGDAVAVTWYVTDTWRTVDGGVGSGAFTSAADIPLTSGGLFQVVARAEDARGGVGYDTTNLLVLDPADSCATPWVIPSSGPFPTEILTSNAFAGPQASDPSPPCIVDPANADAGRYGSIWLEFTPTETATYTVSTCGSGADTVLSAWTGDACGPYTAIAAGCNDDDERVHCRGNRTDSFLELELEAGVTSRFVVASYASSGRGPVRLQVDCLDCSGASEGFQYFVAAAARADGLNDTRWVTDLALLNPSTADAQVDLTFLPVGADNSDAPSVERQVASGTALELPDVVATTFGVTGGGALRLLSSTPLVVASRTYNDATEGTFGQYIPGSTVSSAVPAGAETRLIGLDQTADFHTNLGFANTAGLYAPVGIELYDAAGALVGSRTETLPPFGWLQVNEIYRRQGVTGIRSGSAVVRHLADQGAVLAYASVVDDATGDPVYVTPVAAATADEPLRIAAAAHATGLGGSVWRTDLDLHNPGDAVAEVFLELFPAGTSSPPPPVRVSLAAGASHRLEDVVSQSFGRSGSGSIRARVEGLGSVMVTSRTYNLATTGTYGQFIPGVPESTALGQSDRAVLTQLRQNEGFRTNLGLVNLGDVAVRIDVEMFDAAGGALGTATWDLAPGAYFQANTPFPEGTELGFAVVSSTTEGARYLAYASVVDRGTDDPVFMPAVPVS